MLTLSKSDFKIASNCAKKLQYKKQLYPNASEENDFLQQLAEGGYIVGKLATIVYAGIEITGKTKAALAQTSVLLQQDKVTLHEAAIQSGQKLIRIDILKKDGNTFELIEVKSKSFNSEEDKSEEKKNMEEYIEDVVFQTLVLQEAYPEATINSWLLMPDKSKLNTIEGLASWFKIIPPSIENTASGTFKKVEVEFIDKEGTPDYELKRSLLIQDDLLQFLCLNEKVKSLGAVIKNRADKFLRILNNDFYFESGDYKINKACKGCEYKADDTAIKNGYKECWGEMAKVDPNIFDLYFGGSILNDDKGSYLNDLIEKQTVSLTDIDIEKLKKKNGDIGSRAERQLIQINNTKHNKEWVSAHLKAELNGWQYPLHFIDFETYTGAIPSHKGMKPYEVIAFQWSCHTIHKVGDAPVHTEWINTEATFPNFRFAQSLMNQIGLHGTPLMWATHENTVLRTIYKQMEHFEYENQILKDWLFTITKDKDREGRLIDMNAVTLKNYFHPYMKGKTSIKKTLPAIWNHHPFLYEVPWFKQYYKADNIGNTLNPYQTLKYIFATGSTESELAEREIEEVVKEGGAAMKAYNDMMYGDEANKNKLKQQLLEYCKLDTMAMVIIWEYWRSVCK